MKRLKYAVAPAVVALLGAGALALAGRPVAGPPKPPPAARQRGKVAPDHAVYRMLLHHTFVLDQKAAQAESRGDLNSARAYRDVIKSQVGLSDEQMEIVSGAAVECQRRVSAQDAKARAVIAARRAHYPGGRLPAGAEPLPPSPELEAMQHERNLIILGCRDRLRRALGEQEWPAFHESVRRHIAPTVTVTEAAPGGEAPPADPEN